MRNNFKTKIRMLTSAAALGVAMMVGASMPANAIPTTLNFIDFIDPGGTQPGVLEQAVTAPITVQGVGIKAYGSNSPGVTANFTNAPFAYLDGGGAGIGVCQTLAGTQCTPPSDDNVTGTNPTEILSLAFFGQVTIIEAFFRNDGHVANFNRTDGKINVGFNGGMSTALTLENGASGLGAKLTDFSTLLGLVLGAGDTIDFGYNNQQFYLSGLTIQAGPGGFISAVPLPASVYLFGTGLLGIGFLARRRRRKTKGELKFA